MLSTMCSRSTKGASKQRRENINCEISVIRDLLPIQGQVRSRLSQLQIMSLCKAYIGKSNLLNSAQEPIVEDFHPFDFTQALAGFLLITDMKGRIFYVSDNVTDYLAHSMVDVITQAETVYELIHAGDQPTFRSIYAFGEQQQQPSSSSSSSSLVGDDHNFAFTCRMGMLKHPRRNPNFDRYKKMRVFGRKMTADCGPSRRTYLVALCTPRLNPMMASDPSFVFDTMIFKSVHSMDMKFVTIDHNGEHHLGYTEKELSAKSWYEMIHPDDIEMAINKHKELIQQVALEASCSLSVRVQSKDGEMMCLQVVMKKESSLESNSESSIVCWNQVVCPNEMAADDKDDLLHQMNTISYLDQYCSSQNSDKQKFHLLGSLSSSASSSSPSFPSPSSSSSSSPSSVSASTSPDAGKSTKDKKYDRSELMERLKRKMQKPDFGTSKAMRVDGVQDTTKRLGDLATSSSPSSSSTTLDLLGLLGQDGTSASSLDQSDGHFLGFANQPFDLSDFGSTMAPGHHQILPKTNPTGAFNFGASDVSTMPTPERPALTWSPSPTSLLGHQYCPANSPGSEDLNNQSFFPVGVGLQQQQQYPKLQQPKQQQQLQDIFQSSEEDQKRFSFSLTELKPQEVDEFFQMEASAHHLLADFMEYDQLEASSTSYEPFMQSFLQQLSAY